MGGTQNICVLYCTTVESAGKSLCGLCFSVQQVSQTFIRESNITIMIGMFDSAYRGSRMGLLKKKLSSSFTEIQRKPSTV